MFDYHEVKAFLEVAECMSFTDAAERLFISQSSLSKTILSLERSLGFKLFVRTNRSIYLTREGQILQDRLKTTISGFDEAIIAARRMSENKAGSFTLTCDSGIEIPESVRELFHCFRQSSPEFEYELVGEDFHNFRRMLIDGSIDAAVVRDFEVSGLHGCESLVLSEITQAFVVRKGHPAVKRDRQIDMEKLADAEFVALYSTSSISYNNNLNKCCSQYGFLPKITKYVANPQQKTDNVLLGDFAMVTDMQDVGLPGDRVAYEKVRGVDKIGMILIWRRDNTNPALQRFVDFVRARTPCEADE